MVAGIRVGRWANIGGAGRRRRRLFLFLPGPTFYLGPAGLQQVPKVQPGEVEIVQGEDFGWRGSGTSRRTDLDDRAVILGWEGLKSGQGCGRAAKHRPGSGLLLWDGTREVLKGLQWRRLGRLERGKLLLLADLLELLTCLLERLTGRLEQLASLLELLLTCLLELLTCLLELLTCLLELLTCLLELLTGLLELLAGLLELLR